MTQEKSIVQYIPIKFGIPMKLVRPIKMCLKKVC
jgi:hypothetical protein